MITLEIPEIVAGDLVAAMPATVHRALVGAFVEVRHARMEREAVAPRLGASLIWLGMIMLGVLTQIAVAVVHLDRLRAQALALFVHHRTATLIGLHEQPFSEPNGVTSRAIIAPREISTLPLIVLSSCSHTALILIPVA